MPITIHHPDFGGTATPTPVEAGRFEPAFPGGAPGGGSTPPGLMDLLDKLPKGLGEGLTGLAGEGIGAMLGPDQATALATAMNVDPASWFGSNLAFGAGEVSAAIPGLEWAPGVGPSTPVSLAHQATQAYLNPGTAGTISSGVPIAQLQGVPAGQMNLTMAGMPDLGAGAAAPATGSAPAAGGFNAAAFAIPAIMAALGMRSMNRADQREQRIAQQYRNLLSTDPEQTDLGDEFTLTQGPGNQQWVEQDLSSPGMHNLYANMGYGPGTPGGLIQETMLNPQGVAPQKFATAGDQYEDQRTAVRYDNVTDMDAFLQHLEDSYIPMQQYLSDMPHFGQSDSEVARQENWMKDNPLPEPGTGYVMVQDRKTGEMDYILPGASLPLGYDYV